MIRKCPHCSINLDGPPYKDSRNTSEALLTLNYRKKIENNLPLISVGDLGYCELCNSSSADLELQGITLDRS